MVSSNTIGSGCLGCDSRYGYNYNARGERVEKTVISGLGKATTTPSIYDESGHLLAELSGSDSTEIIWLEDLPVAVKRAGAVHYIHADHLVTPRAVVTSGTASKAIWQWDFLGTATASNAFGDLEANADPDADGTHFIFDLRFPGQQKDQTGLNYNYFRDYEPATGRYVESDPIGLRGGITTYGYVGGDPVSRTDAQGLLFDAAAAAATEILLHSPAASAALGTGVILPVCLAATVAVGLAMPSGMSNCQGPGDPGCAEEGCPPCVPKVGTIGYRSDPNPSSATHFNKKGIAELGVPPGDVPAPHLNLSVMMQSPRAKGCVCFWHPLKVAVAPPPQPDWVPLNKTRGGR